MTQFIWKITGPNRKHFLEGRSQDGGGVGRGEHFLPHKFIKRAFKRQVNSTKQLLNADHYFLPYFIHVCRCVYWMPTVLQSPWDRVMNTNIVCSRGKDSEQVNRWTNVVSIPWFNRSIRDLSYGKTIESCNSLSSLNPRHPVVFHRQHPHSLGCWAWVMHAQIMIEKSSFLGEKKRWLLV